MDVQDFLNSQLQKKLQETENELKTALAEDGIDLDMISTVDEFLLMSGGELQM